MDSIIHTKVLCFNEKEEELTGKSDDIWIDCAIDLSAVVAIKKDIRGEKFMTAVYFNHGDYFVIGWDYDDVVARWMEAKAKPYVYIPSS